MENIMTLPKLNRFARFTGGATAEKGAGGGDYHDRGESLDERSYCHPDE